MTTHERPVCVQLGAGGKNYEHFFNTDLSYETQKERVDITQRLPYGDESIDFLLAEHLIEHVTTREALVFISEAWRVLKKGGVLRLAFPDPLRVEKGSRDVRDVYDFYINSMGDERLRPNQSVRLKMLLGFEHKALWTTELMLWSMKYSGFEASEAEAHTSAELDRLLGKHAHLDKHCDLELAHFETSVVEGIKI